MKSFIYRTFGALALIVPLTASAQIFSANNAVISINSGATVYCNGGVVLNNSTTFSNNGTLRTTKNSTFASNGNFEILSTSAVSGNGNYWVEQDWINDASFSGGASTVSLFGNTEQFVTSANGTVTEFNNLTLLGNGTGTDRKKSLLGVGSRISTSGILNLNDRELATGIETMTVLNTSALAITNNLAFGNEGFVSSLAPGFLVWNTASSNTYYFPVGSSNATLRYRPVALSPFNANANTYHVRMNNYSANVNGYDLSLHGSDIVLANDLFYHSIERSAGTSNASLAIGYNNSTDGDWSGAAQWNVSAALWLSIAADNLPSLGNYSAVEQTNWNFGNPAHPYTLINLGQELIIPNVFTPNNDGANDTYFVSGQGITEFDMLITNRWGNVVFETSDINATWDGTSGGNTCEDGVYFYVINAKSIGQEYNKQGFITLQSK